MKHIEYKTVLKHLDYNKQLIELGEQGWEFIHHFPDDNKMLFRRNSLTEKKLPLMVKDVPQSSIEKAKNCIRRNKELDEEENNLPVECECSDLKSGSVIKLNNDRKCVSCGKDYSFEPEKTAESDWEREFDNQYWVEILNDYGSIYKLNAKTFIKSLLTSHTEQKKKKLIEKIEKLPRYIYQEEVINLIKEL